MADKVKVYEEQPQSRSIWVWLIPLIILVALGIWWATRGGHQTTGMEAQAQATLLQGPRRIKRQQLQPVQLEQRIEIQKRPGTL